MQMGKAEAKFETYWRKLSDEDKKVRSLDILVILSQTLLGSGSRRRSKNSYVISCLQLKHAAHVSQQMRTNKYRRPFNGAKQNHNKMYY